MVLAVAVLVDVSVEDPVEESVALKVDDCDEVIVDVAVVKVAHL